MSEQENEPQQGLDEKQKRQKDEVGNVEKLSEELEELPPQLKRFVQATLSMQRISSSSLVSPIQEKINEQHISRILDIVEKDDERAFADTESARKYTIFTIIIFLVFFGSLTIFLVNKDIAVYQEILRIIIIFGGGFGSGFGYKGYLEKRRK
ncbi:hypothetical protein I8752_09610 [Nostocaceae cyanobacterium CENA369]|uniref:Uncharacterized protein n=1 Tax=Dendronalium phyllosphericum CENA369 TaxID=1725256 RepID=A0A8J7HZP5_9NOST|nr:hypothetical protein [Dendronalium phyllosphericum]MBH8573269.1 hypothetical protein [Dendronalium phyllosphericum CENA369]